MKKLLVMLCVAGLLTGCAVSGEKKTDQEGSETGGRGSEGACRWRRKPTRRKKKTEKRRTARTIGNISRSRQTVLIIFPWTISRSRKALPL